MENVQNHGGNGNAKLLVKDAAETSGQSKPVENCCTSVKSLAKMVEM